MASSSDSSIERRRQQNRLAQRRYRWKQSEQLKAATDKRPENPAISGPSRTKVLAPKSSAGNTEVCWPPLSESLIVSALSRPKGCVLSGNFTLLDFERIDYAFLSNSSIRTALAPSPASQWGLTEEPGPEPLSKSQSPHVRSDADKTSVPGSTYPSQAHSSSVEAIDGTSFAAAHSRDVSVKSGRQSPLHTVAQTGHTRILCILLKHQTDCDERDSDGLTPLMHAVIGGHEDIVGALLEHGAWVGKQDDQGRSALHWAALKCREALLITMLKHVKGDPALLDIGDSTGMTPLHMAVETGFEAGVEALLSFGAQPNL